MPDHGFPHGDFSEVDRAALVHAEQRVARDDHPGIEQAADELLQRLDAQCGWVPRHVRPPGSARAVTAPDGHPVRCARTART